MRRILTATLLTTAISSLAVAFAAPPAYAQMDQTYGMDQADSGISLDYFSDQLAPFGYWLYSDRWGLVWQPGDMPYDFRPYYTAGRWINTDEYGWYWQSDLPWGDIPFHYGRWVNDPDDGWLWIPGYTWSPGWVTWRTNGRYIGWMPMPPDDAFLGGRPDIGIAGFGGLGLSLRLGGGDGGLYGYSRWYGPRYNESLFAQNWVFVGAGDIVAPNYRTVAITDPVQVVNIIHQTRDVTRYTVVNNYVVNRSVDVRVVERVAGHPIPVVRAATVIRHPNLVATAAAGQRVQMRMRLIAPRGTGIANSAPPPPARVVAKLSTRVPPQKAGRPPMHLFNKAAVSAPEARAKFQGKPAPEPGPGAGPGMSGPNGGPPGMGPGGPMGERPARGGLNGPNGGPSEQPGMSGPNGPAERPHREPPNGMNGPNGGPPNAAQPGGEMGGPNGPSAPGTRPHREPPGGMTGPNGGSPQGAEPPDNGAGPNAGPPGGGMNGPGGPTGGRPHRAPPAGGAAPDAGPPGGGMSGPSGPGAPAAERPHREPPNGMNGPNGGPPPGAGRPGGGAGPNAEPPHKPEPNTPQGNPPHPPKKHPPENPPQNPPQ